MGRAKLVWTNRKRSMLSGSRRYLLGNIDRHVVITHENPRDSTLYLLASSPSHGVVMFSLDFGLRVRNDMCLLSEMLITPQETLNLLFKSHVLLIFRLSGKLADYVLVSTEIENRERILDNLGKRWDRTFSTTR
ncbi:hypothetical protein KQX54_008191 [Cotesia glomerata]|uniref:Uncharacterized protein n=1 Tax=Cotesia glomerata TaxID=32391 RepID=A0AAV7I8A5_COTGL|nr:hypothetical protein KQX54_008191 [Cotesia glomerata]